MNFGGSAEGGLMPSGRVILEPGQNGLMHKNLCVIAAGSTRNSSGDEFSFWEGKAGGGVCMQR